MRMLQRLFVLCSALWGGASLAATNEPGDRLWQQVYDARAKVYEASIGKLPEDILKIGHLFGVWPGGGLFVIPANKLGSGLWAYSTFGFTNPDMPTGVTVSDVSTQSDGNRVTRTEGTLKKKLTQRERTTRPGYGYEMLVLAKENAQWPLWLLQWAANAEILNDADLLSRVEKHDGLTVEDISVGNDRSVHVLIAKARAPLPAGAQLPNGKAVFLVATVITEAEMLWSMKNGRGSLLNKLKEAGVGQISVLDRASVVK